MDERFLKEEGLAVFTGNELIVKGALEAEVALITGYPGSPISDIFDIAYSNRELLQSHGILAELANNEALAVARVNGSRMAGVRAMAVMKSVGLHVAADGLALGNLAEPSNAGGGVVVVGDDPWIDSTQVNNDSRYLSQHLHMPVLEPATFQEIKDWVGQAFELSSVANLYLTYLITTHQADGGGTVWVRPNRYPKVHTGAPATVQTSRIDLENNVLLPPRSWAREASLPARFENLLTEVRRRALNSLQWPKTNPAHCPIGFVASGLAYCYLEHALLELGLTGQFPLLKLGLIYPVDSEALLGLAEHVDTLYVVEEKRGFIEDQVVKLLNNARQAGRLSAPPAVWGKMFANNQPGFPATRGLTASLVAEKLLPIFFERAGQLPTVDWHRLRAEAEMWAARSSSEVTLPARTPTFCPGCPHRDSSSVLLQIKQDFNDASYMRRVHGHAPVDLVFHGETGCFSMLMFEPNKPLMHNYSGMGLGGGTGAGADPFITNKQVVFLGDSTFFHSGMIALSDSVKNGQDITYVILDNKTTAMTGHQPTPGTDRNVMGERTFAQSIEAIVGAIAGQAIPVQRVNPEYRDGYRALLEKTILLDGVKVIIADKECALTQQRAQQTSAKAVLRRDGYRALEKRINISPDVCEFCLECTRLTGCPGLTIEATSFGPKLVTDLSGCVSDGACMKVKACPAFEEITILRTAPPKQSSRLPDLGALPRPTRAVVGDPWYAVVTGVGGMGAGLVSTILVEAAHRDGCRVLFLDKKGLAVRNGSVVAHVILTKTGGTLSPLVSRGKADLLIGLDLLEAARVVTGGAPLGIAHATRTAAVVNLATRTTVRMLTGEDAPAGPTSEAAVRTHTRSFWGLDFSALGEFYFESTLYTNVMLLGAACQLGLLPVSLEALQAAVAGAVPAPDRRINAAAFETGRGLVAHPAAYKLSQSVHTYSSLLQEKRDRLQAAYGSRIARRYHFLVDEAVLELALDDDAHAALALRAYELVHYENIALAERYVRLVLQTAARDQRQWRYAATRAVLQNAFKVMAIKDEVYVAHLLTSVEKHAQDRARYRIDAQNGDRIIYRHQNRAELTVRERTYRWDLVTRDWQLALVKRLKILRHVLPGWHRAEKEFRDWYLELAEDFRAEDETTYRRWVEMLEVPSDVRGYRAIRRPKMDAARHQVELMRRSLPKPKRAPAEASW